MEVDQQTVMRRKAGTGIGNIIGKEAAREPQRKRKTRGAGETVGLTLRLKPHIWRALHEQALNEQTNITQMIIGWLQERRQRQGLPLLDES
jgi:hypothetical protein